MASNYTGNRTATQAPGPTPAFDVSPVHVLPADGDALNAASVAQMVKEAADFIDLLTHGPYVHSKQTPENGNPIEYWRDVNQRVRSGVDHLGFHGAGRITGHTEPWIMAGGAISSTTSNIYNSSQWSVSIAGTSSLSPAITNQAGVAVDLTTSTASSKIILQTANAAYVHRAATVFIMEALVTPLTVPVADCLFGFGVVDAVVIGDSFFPSGRNFAMLYVDPTEATDPQKWHYATCNGTTVTKSAAGLGAADVFADSVFALRIELFGSGYPGGALARFFVGSPSFTATTTATLPADNSLMLPFFKQFGTASVSRTSIIGPCRWQFNAIDPGLTTSAMI